MFLIVLVYYVKALVMAGRKLMATRRAAGEARERAAPISAAPNRRPILVYA